MNSQDTITTISGSGLLYSEGKERFLTKPLSASNGISLNVEKEIKIFGTNATTKSKGVVQLASRQELEQNIAPQDSVLTVDSLKSIAVQKDLSSQPYFWMTFRIEKKKSIVLGSYNIEPTDLRDEDGDFFIFKETSVQNVIPPVFCTCWSTCPYPTWVVNCSLSISEGGTQARDRAKGIEIKISPFFNQTRTFIYDYPVTAQVLCFGPW